MLKQFDENPFAFIFNGLIAKEEWDFGILTIRAFTLSLMRLPWSPMDSANLAYHHADSTITKFYP